MRSRHHGVADTAKAELAIQTGTVWVDNDPAPGRNFWNNDRSDLSPEEDEQMTDIYLCRHGRTTMNVNGLLRGRLDPGLDLVGYAEARELGELLGGLGLTRVISSPLVRAVETARPIAERAGLEVETDDRLLDRAYGQFDGTSSEELVERYGSLDAAPGVEPAEEVVSRGRAVLEELAAQPDRGPIVVVSHDAVIRRLLDELTPTPTRTEHVQPRTGCWSLLRIEGQGWKLLMADSKDDPVETALAVRSVHHEPVFTAGQLAT